MVGPEQLWTACAASLRAQVSDAAWRTWFEDARAVSVDDSRLVLAVPSSLVKERIQTRYLPLVRDALEDTTGASYDVILEVRTDDEQLGEPAMAPVATEVESRASAEITSHRAGDRTSPVVLIQRTHSSEICQQQREAYFGLPHGDRARESARLPPGIRHPG